MVSPTPSKRSKRGTTSCTITRLCLRAPHGSARHATGTPHVRPTNGEKLYDATVPQLRYRSKALYISRQRGWNQKLDWRTEVQSWLTDEVVRWGERWRLGPRPAEARAAHRQQARRTYVSHPIRPSIMSGPVDGARC